MNHIGKMYEQYWRPYETYWQQYENVGGLTKFATVVPKNDMLWYGYENSQQRYEICHGMKYVSWCEKGMKLVARGMNVGWLV